MKSIAKQFVSCLFACIATAACCGAISAQVRPGKSTFQYGAQPANGSWAPKRPNGKAARRVVKRRAPVTQALATQPVAADILASPDAMHPILDEHIHLAPEQVACDNCGMNGACYCSPIRYLFDWSRADLWIGVASFSGQSNFLTTGSATDGQVEGNFGLQEGFNFGSRMPSLLGGQIGTQFGMRFTHSQLHGTAASTDNRTQTFLTGGIFRRVDYGLQGGLVVDYLHDDWIYNADLLQLRGELSFLLSPCHDVGFRFTDSQQTDTVSATIQGRVAPVTIELSALNSYRFFYRFKFGDSARSAAEFNVGFSEDSQAIFGLDLKTALQGSTGLQASFAYTLPPEGIANSYAHEGWNLGLAFVWKPGRVFGLDGDYYRPLFEVADNGSLLTKLIP